MDAITAFLTTGSIDASPLLGALWRASIGGALFAAVIWAICRLIPRLPASVRFWLWWMVSAKLLVGLTVGVLALPLMSAFVLRLPANRLGASPTLFVTHLVQPTRLLRSGREPGTVSPSVKATDAASPENLSGKSGTDSSRQPDQAPNRDSGLKTREPRLPGIWALAAQAAVLLWCVGCLWRLALIAVNSRQTRTILRTTVPASEPVLQEARAVARMLGLRHVPNIVTQENVASPFLTGLIHPVVVLPGASLTLLSAAELRMALAHELTHLRRGDLWLTIIPSLAELLFFFLPVARWASRECGICREEICDSAAVSSLGRNLLSQYGQLLLKVTLAAQDSKHPAPQMGMAVRVSPAFVQLRRRLNSLKDTINRPVNRRQRQLAAFLLALCLPGVLPWHLRALPTRMGSEPEAAEDTAIDLPSYTVVDLGTLGGKFSDAYGIGDNGSVVGTANVFPQGGRGHAFLWRASGDNFSEAEMTDLCAGAVYRHSLAYSVNEKGQVAAAAFNSPGKPNAFLWTPGKAQRRYLGGLPGFRYSRATGINNDGVVVGAVLGLGSGRRGAVRMRAFSWKDGRIQDLGTLGGDFSSAAAISKSGHVVGKSDIEAADGGATHAALWEPEVQRPRDIGTLPGGENSAASAVNSRGEVVGYSEALDTPRRAFVYVDGSLEDLGTLPVRDSAATPISAAGGINDAGYIVGHSSALLPQTGKPGHQETLASRAVLWLPVQGSRNERRLLDLNACLNSGSGWTLEAARAINNQGEIVGVGRVGGKRHAFLLRLVRTAAKLSDK